jgi:hypothetical protein
VTIAAFTDRTVAVAAIEERYAGVVAVTELERAEAGVATGYGGTTAALAGRVAAYWRAACAAAIDSAWHAGAVVSTASVARAVRAAGQRIIDALATTADPLIWTIQGETRGSIGDRTRYAHVLLGAHRTGRAITNGAGRQRNALVAGACPARLLAPIDRGACGPAGAIAVVAALGGGVIARPCLVVERVAASQVAGTADETERHAAHFVLRAASTVATVETAAREIL